MSAFTINTVPCLTVRVTAGTTPSLAHISDCFHFFLLNYHVTSDDLQGQIKCTPGTTTLKLLLLNLLGISRMFHVNFNRVHANRRTFWRWATLQNR